MESFEDNIQCNVLNPHLEQIKILHKSVFLPKIYSKQALDKGVIGSWLFELKHSFYAKRFHL